MKTKNLFLGMFLLAIAGLWTGCSNDEVVTKGPAIEFRPQGGLPQLKAVGTTTDQIETFVVYGADVNDWDNGPVLNLFDGVTVTRQKSDYWLFYYSPTKYYHPGASVANFVAYSPVTANISNPEVSDIMNEASFDYTVVVPDASGNKTQEDLLITGTEITPSGSAVSLNFQHALARVFVKASNQIFEPVIIKSLTLRNLKSTGTLKGGRGPTWIWSWEDPALAGPVIDYPYILAESGVAVKPGASDVLVTSMEQGMMVLPQTTVNTGNIEEFDTGDFALEVNYDVANLTDQTKRFLLPDGYVFEMGWQYAITMTFTGTAISFAIDVTPWGTPIEEPAI